MIAVEVKDLTHSINNKKIQARYYWNYVLNLEETEKDMKNKINKNQN